MASLYFFDGHKHFVFEFFLLDFNIICESNKTFLFNVCKNKVNEHQYKYFYLYNILTLYILSPPNKWDYIANVCCFAYLSPFVCSEHKNTDKSDLDLE